MPSRRSADSTKSIAQIVHDEGVTLLAFHDTLEDPERPGRMREEWTYEGDHPNEDGYIAVWPSSPYGCSRR